MLVPFVRNCRLCRKLVYLGVGGEEPGDFNVDDQSDSHITPELAKGGVWVKVGIPAGYITSRTVVVYACESIVDL